MSDLIETKNLEWKPIAKKVLQPTVIGNLCEVTSISPENTKADFIVLDTPDWVIVIPELNENFLMVEQWRHGNSCMSREFPGGVVNKGELAEDGARRELLEETGFLANELIHLGTMSPNPALFSNRVHFYLAKDLVQKGEQNLDEEEYVSFLKVPKQEVIENMGSELYCHGLMASALMFYLRRKG